VQLDQIEVIDAEASQRCADLVARLAVDTLAGLRREEEAIAAPRA
jgi:hypothetical protein